jgi:hypothetical protein
MEAVTDLVCQILTIRCEPWKVPPGTTPRLRVWGEGVVRLAPKPGRGAARCDASTRAMCVPWAY